MLDQFGTDYTKKTLQLNDLLPSVNQSETSNSILSTIFQRWLTKPNLTNVAGTIGKTTTTELTPLIIESSPARQAYQLQPVVHIEQGSSETIYDWADIMRKLEFTGVDSTQYHKWGTTKLFDFIPPIDIDKFVNYIDYYWVNNDDTTEQPDYVTITPNVVQYNDWSASNKWVHKNDSRFNVAYAKQAQLPIVEFVDIELSQWVKVERVWSKNGVITQTVPTAIDITDSRLSDAWVLHSERLVPTSPQEVKSDSVRIVQNGLIPNKPASIIVDDYLSGQNNVVIYTGDVFHQHTNIVEVVKADSALANEITLTEPPTSDMRVLIGAYSKNDDTALARVYVRLSPDFATHSQSPQSIDSAGYALRDLSTYKLATQRKLTKYQLPLFNLYSIDGSIKTGYIVKYVEDVSQVVESMLGRRVVINSGDLTFSTDLITAGDELLMFKRGVDGVLSTVWSNPIEYTPRYVNPQRVPISDTTQPGSWEIHPALTSNPLRETRANFRFSEVLNHFQSLVKTQTGTIKIADDASNYLISSIVTDNMSVTKLINFIADDVQKFRSKMEQSIKASLSSDPIFQRTPLTDISRIIYDRLKIQAQLEGGDNTVYDDSLLYDLDTNVGYPKYPSTFGVLELCVLHTPSFEISRRLSHSLVNMHDGVKYFIDLTPVEYIQLETQLSLVVIQSATMPMPSQNFCTWKKSSVDSYRFEVFYFSATPPTTPQLSQTWYNPLTQLAYEWTVTGWDTIAVSSLWKSFSIQQIIAEVFVLQETDIIKLIQTKQLPNRPYLIDGSTDGVLNWLANPVSAPTTTLLTSSSAIVDRLKATYDAFVYQYGKQDSARVLHSRLLTPVSTTDPFTWNYGVLAGAPTLTVYDYYINQYNTPLPNVYPWRIQGYSEKPIWWDEEYQDTTGTRLWHPVMWNNIRSGVIPNGKELPPGVTNVMQFQIIPVNTTGVAFNGYALDDLLPPAVNVASLTNIPKADLDKCVLFDTSNPQYNSLLPALQVFPTNFGNSSYLQTIWKSNYQSISRSLIAMYQVDPIGILSMMLDPGRNGVLVNGLIVSKHTKNVIKNTNPLHGDSKFVDTSIFSTLTFIARSKGHSHHDTSPLFVWRNWSTRLAYETNSLIVPQTLRMYHNCVEVADYKVVLKKSENQQRINFSNIIVTLNKIGTPLTTPLYADWEFSLSSSEIAPTTHSRYTPLEQTLVWDTVTQTLSRVDTTTPIRWVMGESVKSSSLPDSIVGSNNLIVGIIGDSIRLYSTVIDAVADTNHIDLSQWLNSGQLITLRTVKSTFTAGELSWEVVEMDRRSIQQFDFTKGVVVRGVQAVIDFLFSYTEYMQDMGIVVNVGETTLLDPDTNAVVSWQQQITKAVDKIFLSNGLAPNGYKAGYSLTNQTLLDVPSVEVNPFRSTIYFRTPYGVLCDINRTPYALDYDSTAAIFDDTGNAIFTDELIPLRTDRLTTVVFNDTQPPRSINIDRSNARRIAFGEISLDFYEHVILMNQQTSGGLVIYDRFFNLHKLGFNVEFQRSVDFFNRPVMGGFSVTNTETLPNFEMVGEYQRNDYDVAESNELVTSTMHSRQMLGKEPLGYFDTIPVTAKTEFQFWQQMIREKGTKGSVPAFARHRLYDTTEYDEFWAWKLGTFGSTEPRKQLEMRLTIDDITHRHTSLWFASLDYPTQVVDTVFPISTIEYLDQTRWVDFPNYVDTLAYSNFIGYEGKRIEELEGYEGVEDSTYGITGLSFGSDTIDTTTFVMEYPRGVLDNSYEFMTLETGRLDQDDSVVIRHNLLGDVFTYEYVEYDSTNSYSAELVYNNKRTLYFPIDRQFVTNISSRRAFVVVDNKVVSATVDGFRVTLTKPPAVGTVVRLILVQHEPIGIAINATSVNHAISRVRFNGGEYAIRPENPTKIGLFTIKGKLPAYSQISPLRVIDAATKLTTKTLPAWDPANGIHTAAIAQFDYVDSADPASYTHTKVQVSDSIWGDKQLGQYWLDASTLAYKPYFDSSMFTFDEQTARWGELADGTQLKAYQWVSSNVPPSLNSTTAPLSRYTLHTRASTSIDGNMINLLWTTIDSVSTFSIDNPTPAITSFITTGRSVVLYKTNQDLDTVVDQFVGLDYVIAGTPQSFTLTGLDGKLLSLPGTPYTTRTPLFLADLWSDAVVTLLPTNTKTFFMGIDNVLDITTMLKSGREDTTGASVLLNGASAAFAVETSTDGTYTDFDILDVTGEPIKLRDTDIVTIVIPPSDVYTTSYPQLDSNQLTYIGVDVPYVEHTVVKSRQTVSTYYFWSAAPTEQYNPIKSLTLQQSISQLLKPLPSDYFAIRSANMQRIPVVTTWGLYGMSGVHSKAIAIDLDKTLRDKYRKDSSKSTNDQWVLFRQHQDTTLHPAIWAAVVSTITGTRTIDGIVNTIPSPIRASYDYLYNTTLSYGTGHTQTLIPPTRARELFVEFFVSTNLQLPSELRSVLLSATWLSMLAAKDYASACEYVFSTFPPNVLNTFMFNILREGLYSGYQYEGIFKTSYIAVQASQKVLVGR